MRRAGRPAVLLAVAVLLGGGCPRTGPAERSLGTMPAGIVEETFQLSPDLRHAAYVVEQGDRQVLFVDGRPGAEFDRIGRVVLAAGGRWAHAAIRGGQGFVVRNGTESGPWERVGALFFTPDGGRLAFPAGEPGRLRLVVNGRPGETYDDIRSLAGSRDGRLLCFTAELDSQWYVVAGGRRFGPYPEVGAPLAAEDGSRWWCVVRDGESWALLDNGEPGPGRYQRIHRFDADPAGRHTLMQVRREGRFHVVHDGRESAGYDQVVPTSFAFTPDVAHYACVVQDGDSWRYLVDGAVQGPGFAAAPGPVKVGAGGRWVGAGAGAGQAVVLVNGEEAGRHDRARVLGLSADGGRAAWAAADGGAWYVVIDGVRHGPFADVGGLQFSPDGRRSAFAASIGREWVLVVDGEQQGRYDAILAGDWFSPDSRTVACAVGRRGKQVPVVDGVERGSEYDAIRRLAFAGPDRVNFIAARGDTLLAVTVSAR